MTFRLFLDRLTDRALRGRSASPEDAARLLGLTRQPDIMLLVAHANMVRQRFHGPDIDLCAIVNAKSGRCTEDCAFCAQSAHYPTAARSYPLMRSRDITAAARRCLASGARRFSIVTSGRGIAAPREFARITAAVAKLAALPGMRPCASLGILAPDQFARLRQAGLMRYHHNLETAASFYPRICTTHSFAQRAAAVRAAKAAGLEVCCGGILGLGETPAQRIELAFALRRHGVDCVPLNFLNPLPGTPLAGEPPLPPPDILKAIAMFRFVLPKTELRICGGREKNLRTLQPLIYLAGANGAMTGNYLTTAGRDPETDIREIIDLGLRPKPGDPAGRP